VTELAPRPAIAERPQVAPGTPMRKIVPPRLVGPYLTGQRDVLAGYVYRAADLTFTAAYDALGLGFEGSEFTPGTAEFYVIGWPARPFDGYQVRGVAEYFMGPIPIPVGAELRRVSDADDELIAEYDGLVWLQVGV
jgi:hypothetical protein